MGRTRVAAPITLDGGEKIADTKIVLAAAGPTPSGGPKRSCNTGACGACTVILNGMSIKSCSILAAQADGAEILTVEGPANGDKLHPLQKTFLMKGPTSVVSNPGNAYECQGPSG